MQSKNFSEPVRNLQSPSREMLTYVSPGDGKLRRKMIRLIENLSGRKAIAPLYQEIMARELDGAEVWRTSLEILDLQIRFNESRLAEIPAKGPLVFIANHPFGVVDGLILGSLAARVREKFHILVHESLVHQDPRIADFLLPVDFRENKAALQTNLHTRRESIRRMIEGEALAIFPGGGVATARKGIGKIREFEWKRFVASVIHKAGATVVPVYFHGRNSRAFHLVSQISAPLRLGMLLHEVKNKIGKEIHLEIGHPIPYKDLAHLRDRQQLLDHLYHLTMDLGRTSKPRDRN